MKIPGSALLADPVLPAAPDLPAASAHLHSVLWPLLPVTWALLVSLTLSPPMPAQEGSAGIGDGGGGPELEAVRPAVVAPSSPLDLELTGRGFGPGAVVEIEGIRPGRFLSFVPVESEAGQLRLHLPLGFGATPAERRLRVVDAAGRRSAELVLRVDASASASDADGPIDPVPIDTVPVDPVPIDTVPVDTVPPDPDPIGPEGGGAGGGEGDSDGASPRIAALWPEPL
ncbi:MAG: hypothetical protein MI919_06575, partial [Holophagales bacterium]|nr:hypothetical protein [Holophagales bacterium]